jgi:hypothetical protein
MMKRTIAAALIVFASTAYADPKPECKQDAPHTVEIKIIDGKRVLEIKGDIIICQHLPRPGVAYVTAPKNIDYVWESLGQHFLPLILSTVKKAPL